MGEVRELIRNLRETQRTYREISKTLNETETTLKPIKSLIGGQGGDAKSKLMTVGAVCIISPDPFSDMMGWPLIAAGILINKMKGTTVASIYKEIQKINRDLKKLSAMNY